MTVYAREQPDEMFRAEGLAETDALRLPEAGIEIPVAAIYEGIAVQPQITQEPG